MAQFHPNETYSELVFLKHRPSTSQQTFPPRKELKTDETPCSDDTFYSVHAPLDIDTRCKSNIHVEKIDFIAKTCKHNMYTDMFYFFIYFIDFFLIFFLNFFTF